MRVPAGSPEHVPLWRFADLEALRLPQHCVLVGVELLDDATDLPSFRHPVNAAYVLGPERSGLTPAMLQRCRHVVRIPTRFALNLAVAGALVLYDRLLQHGRFAERPVGSQTAAARCAALSPQHSRLDEVLLNRGQTDFMTHCLNFRIFPSSRL
jgi:tRNA C32,U32 (ribose-2'-O)-methylase TrmJ